MTTYIGNAYDNNTNPIGLCLGQISPCAKDASACVADFGGCITNVSGCISDVSIISVDNIERLTELIGQMKPKYRDPLRLLAMGYTNREIAKSLGLTDEVVRTRLFRGRKLLWKELSNHE